ncbi:MAG TPA: nucleotidyltransferase domain-containing protein [Candidatus Eisenbacteria bacterium]|nr:nucleotidyltransferase domain-containing protein [Candidatus Eisenbacteria bacterium]
MALDVAPIAARLAAVDGVVAVALGGSRARGAAGPESDHDLGLYYDPARPPSRDALNALARELDDRHPTDAVTRFGEWGPWINGGAWLTIGGARVDWLFKDLARIGRVVAECRAGRPEIAYQLGHPHAFVSAIYLAEIDCCVALEDPSGVLGELKRLVRPYPRLLKEALVQKFLFEADFSLRGAEKAAGRGDVVYVAGCLYRAVACLVQVLFAVNERYCTNEKGALRDVEAFARKPDDFVREATRVLGAPGATAAALAGCIATGDRLVAAVRALA